MLHKRTIFFLLCFVFSGFFGDSALADVYSVSFRYDENVNNLEFVFGNDGPVSVDASKTLSTHPEFQMYPEGRYEAVFVSVKGNEIDRKRFDVVSGDFVVDFPYYSIAKTLNIHRFDSQEILLTYDLSAFTSCFMNGICEYEKGENLRTCISDCASDTVQFSEETKKLLKQNNDVIKDPKSGEVLLRGIQPVPTTSGGGMAQTGGGSNMIVLIISGIILLLVGIGVWILVKLRKRNKQYGL